MTGTQGIAMEREQGGRPDHGEKQVATETEKKARDMGTTSQPEVSGEDAEHERVMVIGRQVMSDYHAVLAALAK